MPARKNRNYSDIDLIKKIILYGSFDEKIQKISSKDLNFYNRLCSISTFSLTVKEVRNEFKDLCNKTLNKRLDSLEEIGLIRLRRENNDIKVYFSITEESIFKFKNSLMSYFFYKSQVENLTNRDVLFQNRDVLFENRDVLFENRDVLFENRDVLFDKEVSKILKNVGKNGIFSYIKKIINLEILSNDSEENKLFIKLINFISIFNDNNLCNNNDIFNILFRINSFVFFKHEDFSKFTNWESYIYTCLIYISFRYIYIKRIYIKGSEKINNLPDVKNILLLQSIFDKDLIDLKFKNLLIDLNTFLNKNPKIDLLADLPTDFEEFSKIIKT